LGKKKQTKRKRRLATQKKGVGKDSVFTPHERSENNSSSVGQQEGARWGEKGNARWKERCSVGNGWGKRGETR